MNNLYFIKHWIDNGYNYDTDTVAVWLDKEVALDFATRYHLEHNEIITVEERQEGVQHEYKVKTIHKYKHYDYTEALFSMVCWYDYGVTLSQNQVIAEVIKQASPLVTENVDFNKLYQLYIETWAYDETL